MEENLFLEQLFDAYKLTYSNSFMTEEQNKNLQIWHEKKGASGITLSQIDTWMLQAGMIKKKVLSITETGMIFSKFK